MLNALPREGSANLSGPSATRSAGGWKKYLALFAAAFVLLFLASNRVLVVYDEGILLTNAMRVLAGQVIHRDFYYNYGPASIYILAGLFKVFGSSALIERLVALAGDAFLVVTMYAITSRLTRRRLTRGATVLCFLWIFAVGSWSLLTAIMLWATWLVVRAFERDLPAGRGFATGVLVGIATLFRYEMGLGTLACHLLIFAIAVGLRVSGPRSWVVSMGKNLWAYGLGFGVVVAPVAWVYLRLGVIHDLLFDIVIYTAHHYRGGRRLPFPRPQVAQLQDLVVYVIAILIVAALYVAGRYLMEHHKKAEVRQEAPQWVGVLIAFGILAAVLYAKGMVRIGVGQEAMSALMCIILTAVLLEHHRSLGIGAGRLILIKGAAVLLIFFTLWADLHPLSSEHKFKTSMLLWLVEPGRMAPQPPYDRWCREKTAAARGVCYVLDDDHIQTVEFLDTHTAPGDRIYVGLPQHDRVLEDDNITYFAAQRLPATKWSHFDPFLQNTAPTQHEMISDLERYRPPYVVLDSEFDALHEPNGSSVHTGVHLLDDYIAQHYRRVKTFGEMTVLQRVP